MNLLEAHELKLWLRVTVRDPEGRVEYHHEQPGMSFLEQQVRLYRQVMSQANETIVDVGGTSRSVTEASANPMRVNGAIADANEGVVVGSSFTPVTVIDRALGTKIANGTGTGQLLYLATAFGDFSADVGAGTAQVLVTRQFLNSSGGTVTVREAGLYCNAANFDFCIVRDVLPTEVEVQNNRSLAIDYLVRTSLV